MKNERIVVLVGTVSKCLTRCSSSLASINYLVRVQAIDFLLCAIASVGEPLFRKLQVSLSGGVTSLFGLLCAGNESEVLLHFPPHKNLACFSMKQSVFEFVAPELDRLLDGKEAPVFSTRLSKRSAGSASERPRDQSEPLAERYRSDELQKQACQLQEAYVLALIFVSFRCCRRQARSAAQYDDTMLFPAIDLSGTSD